MACEGVEEIERHVLQRLHSRVPGMVLHHRVAVCDEIAPELHLHRFDMFRSHYESFASQWQRTTSGEDTCEFHAGIDFGTSECLALAG